MGHACLCKRHYEGSWLDGAERSERILDETYGSGYVRTLTLKLERVDGEPRVIGAHSAGTLHHLYVISGRVWAGSVTEPVDLSAGDFIRFPGDTPHLLACRSERASAHMVTTVPQVRQFGPTVINDGNTERLPNGDEAAASR